MTFKRFLALSILSATCAFSFGEVGAQSLSRDGGPAETPPASFKGTQYVDSKGCVYIRAGIDGNTSWVPRVSRSRKVVCGLTPSLGASARTTTAEAPRAAAAPVQIGANIQAPKSPEPATAVRPARTTVASVLAPRPVRTVASKPAPARAPSAVRSAPQVQRVNIPQPSGVQMPQRRVQTARVQTPLPQVQPRAVRVAPQVNQQISARRVTVQPRVANTQTCPGASAVSQRYIGGRGTAVRCGPQDGAIVTTRAGDVRGTFRSASGQVLAAGSVNPNAIVVPRHVYEEQQAARVLSPTPQGYRQAWTDDRLNTRRTHQTFSGKAQTDLIWSQTVPRRLIVRSTGRDVTRSFPGLRYPYTSQAQQAAAMNQGVHMGQTIVSSKGQAVKRVQRVASVQKQQRVSTRSTAPRQPAQAAGKRFVQVGTFGVASNAQNTANRLQRMGMPVRIGKFVRGGKEMRIVLAGPFGSSAHTGGALQALRNAGFRDAFARN